VSGVSDGGPRFGLGRGKVFPAADARRLLNPARRLVQPPRRVVRHMDLRATDRVLEIGPGPGYFSGELARSVPRGRVVLFDLQAEMLRMAREQTRLTDNVGAVQGDAACLPYPPACFDAVLLVTVLGEVPDPAACAREISRVLRPGGHVSIAETRRDSDFIALRDLRGLLEPAGFTLESRHGIPWEYVARFRAS
jgi:ubiquinone/menaquinone biosynthesis C-methylase UbiE